MRYAVVCALLVASCQRKDQPAESGSAISSPASTPAPPPQGSQGAATTPTKDDAPASNLPQAPLPPLPDPLPGKRIDMTAAVGSAWRAVIADVVADKKRELVVVDSAKLRVLDAAGKELVSAPVTSGILVLVAADVDGDAHAEILAGWGQTRDWKDGRARITLHRMKGGKLEEEVIAEPQTTRAEVVAILPDKPQLLVAYFDSKFMVTSATAKKGGAGWQLEPIASIRMATSYARGDVDGDGKPDLVVGRVYGDDKGIDGDAFVLGPGTTRTKLPTTRGLRSVAIAGGEIFVGDGWHQNYGQHARGLLTRIRHDNSGFTADLVENTAGQYGIERIVPATVDGKQALVTLGSHYVRVFARDGERWRGLTIAGASRDIAVGDFDGAPGDEILVVGDKSELVDLRGVSFQ